ncbi:hypothetical protein GDO86_017885 [Hymenochirus boettgeri]|uniref:Uncharacterized protein n=1 Tax=Hymenochirus boettgeri TaxID=247094 RepID=A0A8T2I9I1_9PIPI|nr:hypothetical protein GDO86_017885 [Hymenochirus boettgeri]
MSILTPSIMLVRAVLESYMACINSCRVGSGFGVAFVPVAGGPGVACSMHVVSSSRGPADKMAAARCVAEWANFPSFSTAEAPFLLLPPVIMSQVGVGVGVGSFAGSGRCISLGFMCGPGSSSQTRPTASAS